MPDSRGVSTLEGVVDDITSALAELEHAIEDPSLANGLAGVALFHSYTGDERRSVACLERAVGALRSRSLGPSLCSGFAGIAWVAEHLRRRGIGTARDRCVKVDEALLRQVERSPSTSEFDLLYGLVGIGVYAWQRLPHDNGARLLTAVVDRLAETARRSPDGVAWESRAEWVPEAFRAQHPARCYDLGLAHGVPGVVALLGLAVGAGVAEPVARPLLRDAVGWLLAQRLEAPAACYPVRLAEGEDPVPARSAWCYGDPGVAAALAVAGTHAGESAWVRQAVEIARAAGARPEAETGVVDASLCHGSAGLALINHRLATVTGDEGLRHASARWVDAALTHRRPGVGVAGFPTWSPDESGRFQWESDPGLLTGAAGVGLAVLTVGGEEAAAWDQWLLMPQAAEVSSI